MVRRKELEVKTFRCFKTKFEANTTTPGNAFIIDLFKILLGLNIFWGLKIPLNLLDATPLVCEM